MLFVLAMPVVTLAGPEEDSMGRGGRARPRRQRLGEVDVNGPVDLTDEELDLSRRVIEGELNLEAAVDQLREMFQRMPSSRRPPGGPPGGQPQ